MTLTMLRSAAAAIAFSAVVSSAVAAPPPAYFVDEAKLPFAELTGQPSQRLWGVHGGAGYRIEVPAQWNGKLVMWAHGYRGDPATDPSALARQRDRTSLDPPARDIAWQASPAPRALRAM